ncbi:hypothetical protein QQF73_18680 [Marinobacter sp. M216]|uniref:SPOR domain-containing protein n=1 Tax=Marinobacter albus TaxID=3030833 RepID=A0ABT7HH14_9GAMM|nr:MULTISPECIES: hypothetical protein [unclassified Marinobacter]MDK9559664.1 hypothetical protein [Marinobacter sp. M216]
MKWLAFLLLILNLLVWHFAGTLQGPANSASGAAGNLPRVASLKSTEEAASKPSDPEVPDVEPPAPEDAPAGDDGSEVAVGAAQPGQNNEQEAVVAEPAAVPPDCVRMGWFGSLNAARALVANQPLADQVDVTVEEVERELTPYHWVIIPPQPRAVALKQFRDIQRQGIDSYLVTEGENRNAISLGLFESREAAISVLEEKKRQNFNAVLANFPRNQISYALVFEAEPGLAKELVEAVKADYGGNFDFVEINPCEGVATPPKNP